MYLACTPEQGNNGKRVPRRYEEKREREGQEEKRHCSLQPAWAATDARKQTVAYPCCRPRNSSLLSIGVRKMLVNCTYVDTIILE